MWLAGAYQMAYMVSGPDCDDWSAASYSNNEAHSTMVGTQPS